MHVGPLHPEPGKQLLFPQITYYQKERLPLHLAVSAIRDPQTLKVEEWRWVTNLAAEHLGRVPKLYAQRMPPEEVHRDSKREFAVSGFGLCHLGRLRPDRAGRETVEKAAAAAKKAAENAQEAMKQACERLIHVARQSQRQARRVCVALRRQGGKAAQRLVKRWYRRGYRFRAGIEGRISVPH